MSADRNKNKSSLRVALVISTLGPGGAEHVMTRLANHLATRAHHVDLITLDSPDNPPHYALNPAVHLRRLDCISPSLGLAAAICANINRIRILHRTFSRLDPDVVLSFLTATNVLALLAACGTRVPVVVAERASLAGEIPGRIHRTLRRLTYPHARAVVVQTPEEQRILHDMLPKTRADSAVIPNPVARSQRTVSGRGLVFVGRFSQEKRPMDVLEAFALAREHLRGRTLTMVGDGPLRADVQARAQALGLSQHVHFTGVVPDAGEHLAHGDIFVLASAHEGFPNALCEAMAHGLACVASNGPGGCAHIVQHERNGLLVPVKDVRAMADAMIQLAQDESLRTRLGTEAVRVCQTFEEGAVLDQWEELLLHAGGRPCAA
ncbi:glycosyltransferase [Pseudodesulfovibrio senegalensis]|uniref:Glycosyltransferase family 4 protein n=1 Tax=Pseudodesulfovibrio senegalensis TaxID=1721087 RepID=A0A6N6N0P5_9BACT|nr:glycosyltransferase [Pseudodesulfovibrio senegalensis]KAB1441303.1 glycosyltransferase family 4 protein [Pseudodesulfovibrio senegalensis]